MNENNDMRGEVTLVLTDRRGEVVLRKRHRNRIVRSGRQLVAELFAGPSGGAPPTKVTHMAVGTDGTPSLDAQTALLAQRDTRKPIEPPTYLDIVDNSGGSPVQRVRASLTSVFDFNEANGAAPLREAGIFTAAAGGVMYNRVVFDPVTKTTAFKLTLVWDVVF